MEGQDTGEKCDDKKPRKPRKRMKAIFAKIRNQMEFYFGDANFHKDRFMKKIIEENAEGYVDLDIFLKFNKIASLTDDVNVIADALMYKSKMLEVNPDKTQVRRITPISEPKNLDERTVYVESLPSNVDHEWMKKLFSACGKVAYVSLPRYPSTRDLKGFAFVEFETVEGALAACEELNNPPAELAVGKLGMFPKTSHQLDALKKKLPEDQIKDTEEKVKEMISVSGGSPVEENEEIKEGKEADNEPPKASEECIPGKRQRSVSENSVECPTPTKRKKSDIPTDYNTASDTDKGTQGGKKKSRKRKSRSKTCETNAPDSDVVNKSDSEVDKSVQETVPEKKQKLDENIPKETGLKVEVKSLSKGNDKENSGKKKKKRLRNKKEKEKKEKEIPELRVIPKTEWLKLRKEYLELQKTNMRMLKKTLNEKMNEKTKVKADKKKRKDIEFIANVIVRVTSEEAITRKQLKESLKEDIQIAYVDLHDGLCEGHIRCENSESATKILQTSVDTVKFSLLSGDAETQYWDKLSSDRETKLSNKCRPKKRGHQKLMDKAQKASLDTQERKHIVFDED